MIKLIVYRTNETIGLFPIDMQFYFLYYVSNGHLIVLNYEKLHTLVILHIYLGGKIVISGSQALKLCRKCG